MINRIWYQVLNAVARDLLRQGFSVILDSPCFYVELLERGQRLAQEAGATYRYIECRVADLDELDRRLRTRPRLPSQLVGVRVQSTDGSGKIQVNDEVFHDWIANMKRPAGGYLVLDTTRPLEEYLDAALAYIRNSSIR